MAALLAHAGGAAAASAPSVTVTSHAGSYEVRGVFSTRAPLPIVWQVLTDYDHIGSFVSSMSRSEVLSRSGDTLRVRQAADVRAFGVHRTAHLMLAVLERPHYRIEFTDISGEDFSSYVGAWSLRAGPDSTVVSYSLDAAPHASAPRWISRGIMSHMTSELLSQVRTEIEKRAKAR